MRALLTSLTIIAAAALGAVVLSQQQAIGDSIRLLGERLANAAAWALLICAVAFAAAALAGGAYWIHRDRSMRHNEHMRQRDGSFPLIAQKTRQGIIYINPNNAHGLGIQISHQGEVAHLLGGMDEEAALQHAMGWLRVKFAQAIHPGDNAYIAGGVSRSPALGQSRATNALDNRMANGQGVPALPAPPEPRQLAMEAPREWIADPAAGYQALANAAGNPLRLPLGAKVTGEPVYWQMPLYPHLRVHGMTQNSGKSNAILTLLAGAAAAGHFTMVLDARSFKDFRPLEQVAELVDTRDPAALREAIEALEAERRQRDAFLATNHARTLAELSPAPARLVVAVSEAGAMIRELSADSAGRSTLNALVRLVRLGGATGIHILLEDQNVDRSWPLPLATNCMPVSGYLPLNYDSTGGNRGADKLAPHQFLLDGAVFATWDMGQILPRLIPILPRRRQSVIEAFRVAGTNIPQPLPTPPAATTTYSYACSDERSPECSEARSPEVEGGGAPRTNSEWLEWALAYAMGNPGILGTPPSGIRAMARAMAAAANNPGQENRYVGLASELAATLRSQVRTTNGQRMIDPSRTYQYREAGNDAD